MFLLMQGRCLPADLGHPGLLAPPGTLAPAQIEVSKVGTEASDKHEK